MLNFPRMDWYHNANSNFKSGNTGFICFYALTLLKSIIYLYNIFCPGHSVHCKKGWYLFNNMCYYFGSSTSTNFKTWHDAESTCRNTGGHLTSVNSQAEKDFLVAAARFAKLSLLYNMINVSLINSQNDILNGRKAFWVFVGACSF